MNTNTAFRGAVRSCFAALLAAGVSGSATADVPVPKQTFTTAQLYQPLKSFSSTEIGLRPTWAAMHRGHLVISGGRFGGSTGDPTGYGRLTTWRLSQAGTPNVVNPSLVGVHNNDAIFKSHAMGFVGENCQIRAGKFTMYNLSDLAAPVVQGTAGGGKSSSHSTCRAGKYIYSGGEGYGTASGWVDIWDVSNPASPQFVKGLDLPTIVGFRCASVYVIGNLMVVSASLTNGVATFDLSDPENPLLIGINREGTGDNTYTSYLSGHRLYSGGQNGGLYIYDVLDPANIQYVTKINPGGSVRYPVLQDEFIHVGNLGNGRYQKIRIDTVPPQVVADTLMPVPTGASRADTEIAIPIGNLVFVGTSTGDPARPTGWLIPHTEQPDNRAPEVNAVRPLDGETNVATTSMIGVSFTDLLDTPSITNSTVIVRPVGGAALSGIYSNMGGIVNFSPSTPLVPNTTYEIVLPAGGVKDCSGNGVASERVFRFSTGPDIETTNIGLALQYPFDEATGTIATDTTGTLDGTLNNFSATPWSQGLVGRGSLAFDGINDYVSTASVDLGNVFSFSTWVRVASGGTSLQTIAGNCAGGYATNGFKVFVYGSAHASAGLVRLETGNGTTGNDARTPVGALPFDQWVHLAVAVDRSAGTARIYINGLDRTQDSAIRNDFLTNAPLNLGRMSTSNYFLPGGMDDFRLYSRVLNSADVEQLRNECELPTGHWRFNSSTANSAPNGGAVTLSAGGATYNATLSQEGAASLSLNGSSGYGTIPTTDLGNSFTLSGWVNVASGTSGIKTIVANSASGSTTAGFRFFLTGSTDATPGRVVFETGNGTVAASASTASNAFTFNQWTHVAVGVDRARGLARIYINGQDTTASGTVRSDFSTTGAVELGRMSDNAMFLAGNVDDIRIYPRWLSDSELGVLSVGKLLGHWRFDGSGEDDSGFGRTATLLNGAGFTPDRAHGTDALNLDGLANGADDHAEIAAVDLGNEFSISMWAQIPNGTTLSRPLIANTNGGSATNGFKWFVNSWNTTNQALLFETGNGTAGNSAVTSTGVFGFSQWNHVAAVVDKAAGRTDIYVNRQLVSTDNTVRNDFATNALLKIGRFLNGTNFHGQIDDVRIYAKKLSGADIGWLGDGSPNTAPITSALTSSSSAATTGTQVTLTATATDPNLGDDLLYRFDFGDGITTAWTASNSAVHSYNAPGRYTVTVFVSDGFATISRTLTQIVYNTLTAAAPSISAEIVYDSSRNKVWCVVPDGDASAPAGGRVVRFDANTRAVDFRVPVGAEPVALSISPDKAKIWVTCKTSSEIKIIDAATGAVTNTIALGRGVMPTSVAYAPDGSAVFIGCEGAEGVYKYSPTTLAKLAELDLGAAPRGLAVSSDSTRVFASRFRSPDNRGEVWEVAATGLTLVRTFALNADSITTDGPNTARGVANYLSQVVISPDGLKAWLPGKKDNIFRGQFRDSRFLGHDNTVRSIIAQLNLTTNVELSANRVDLDNLGLPVATCFSPRGDLVFVAMIGNEQVAVIDANSRATLPSISTADGSNVLGYAPSGLCVSPDGSKLYVHNFLERKVRVFNISALTAGTGSDATLLGTVSLALTEPLSTSSGNNVLLGKKLFYNSEDPRLANEGYISCASCHLGGDHDGRTWDLTQFGEGLRNTIDLRGHAGMGQGPLHWSANFDEVQDFEIQIRDLGGGSGLISGGTPNSSLGTANAGRSADLDALAAYVASLSSTPVSPFRNANGTFTATAVNGQTHFTNKGCASCHSGSNLTDSSLGTFTRHNIGTINTASGKRLGGTLDGLDTPTLRGLWSTAPYLHRGQALDLNAVFNTTNAPAGTAHARFRELTVTEQGELLRYLLELE